MRAVALLMMFGAACGSETPMLGGVPHPNNAAMAGGVAAAAAALTLADPNGANAKAEAAKKPEQEQRPVEVKEQVPASALDHLDEAKQGSGSGPATTSQAPPPPKNAPAKKVVIPSPHDAVDPGHADVDR